MIVRKDAMDNLAATEDDDFDALLNASSLGAPHVLAETAPIPADVRRRLTQAAARPARHDAEPAAQSENDCPPQGQHLNMSVQLDLFRLDMEHSLSLDDLRRRADDLRRKLMEAHIVVLAGPAGTGKSSSAACLLQAFDSHERVERPAPVYFLVQPTRRVHRPFPEAVPLMWQLWGSSGTRVDGGWRKNPMLDWHAGLTSAEFDAGMAPTPHRQWPLYVLDDLSISHAPPPQSQVRPAQMTELLAYWATAAHCAVPSAQLGQEPLTVRTWLLDRCGHDARNYRVVPPATLWEQQPNWTEPWSWPACVPRSTPALTPWRACALPSPSALHAFRARQLTPLPPHAFMLLDHGCRFVPLPAACAVDTADSVPPGGYSHTRWCWTTVPNVRAMPALPALALVNCHAQGDSWPAPQRSKAAAPVRHALRIHAERTEDGAIAHATLLMTMHQKEDGRKVQVPVRLTYRSADPYAVEAVFHPGRPDDEVVWNFARDLLIEGLEHRAGEGDVTVWSPPGRWQEDQERCTLIQLSSPEGTALLSASRVELKQYLDKTLSLVAAGTEHQRLGGALDRLESELGELTCPGFND